MLRLQFLSFHLTRRLADAELLTDLLAWIQQANVLLPTEKNAAHVSTDDAGGGKGNRGKQKLSEMK